MLKKLILITAISSMVVGLSPAGASPYMVEDLGPGIGYGINDFGDVAGKSFDSPSGAAAWVGGLRIPLHGNYQDTARDINNAGVVAGETYDCPTGYRAPCGVVWYGSYQAGERRYLRGLGEYVGYAPSSVGSINNGGFVVGHSGTIWQSGYFSNYHATIWDPDGNPTDLGVWPGDEYSHGVGINDPAHVAGHSKEYGGPLLYMEAALPDPGGTELYLVQIPEVPDTGWVGAINNANQIVGHYAITPNNYLFKADPVKPWLLAWGQAPWNVTHISVSGPTSPSSINDAGEMVGLGPSGAFVWNAWDGMQQLESLIDPLDPLYGQLTLREAKAINNYGWIVATGLYKDGDPPAPRVIVLRPMSLGAAYLTTGSPVSISQVVDTPDVAFDMKFDYRFETTTGVLTVRLAGSDLVTIPAPSSLVTGLQTRAIAIGDPHLNERVELEFELDGTTGSKVVLTNILFPGLENGRFSGELYGWTADVSTGGSVEPVELEIPEEPEELAAVIDIDPDVLNRKSKGQWITSYVELPEGYSVDDIDQSTVAITKVGGEAADIPAEEVPTEVGDYDLDGITDLMVKFPRADVAQAATANGEVDINASGELMDGTVFSGMDRIRVIQ